MSDNNPVSVSPCEQAKAQSPPQRIGKYSSIRDHAAHSQIKGSVFNAIEVQAIVSSCKGECTYEAPLISEQGAIEKVHRGGVF